MAEAKTVARPYAEAVFALAREANALPAWSQMLAFAATAAADPQIVRLAADPNFDRQRLLGLLLAVCGERLNAAGQNLLRVLVENRRLAVLPQIAEVYEELRNAAEARIESTVTAAVALEPAQLRKIEAALTRRLGREVHATARIDPAVVGGVVIRAGDLVIDASVRGRLRKLAASLHS